MRNLISKLIPQKLKLHYINIGKQMAFNGNNVYCQCCNRDYITFLPFGLNKRANALCPGCSSLERQRMAWYYLKNSTGLLEDKIKMLHIAPEKTLFDLLNKYKNIEYISGDLQPEDYSYIPGIIKLDITQLPFNDNSLDVVFCSHVLEHIPDDLKALQEILRVLKPNGWALLQVPIDYNRTETYEDFSIDTPEGREKAFGQSDHVRIYGQDYTKRLETAGFRVEEIDLSTNLTKNEFFKYGFLKEKIYIGYKTG